MKTEEKQPTKFKFGRNPLSVIIVVLALVLLFFIFYPIYSYTTTWNKNNVTPFITVLSSKDSSDEKISERLGKLPSDFTPLDDSNTTEVIRMNGKDFDIFDVKISCDEYSNRHEGNDQATFTFTISWTDTTTEKLGVTELKPFDVNKKKDIKLASCFAADWVGFCKYQTSVSTDIVTKSSSEDTYNPATLKSQISGLDYFPAIAKTFPVNKTVKAPDLFVAIMFQYEKDGLQSKTYILKYKFDEYNPNAEAGGVYSK